MLTFRPVHGGEEGELWALAKLDKDMHDGRASRGKAGEADGLADSRRNGAVDGRRGSVRAGQGPARGGEAHCFGLRCSQGATPWGLLEPSRWARLLPFLEYFGVALRA